MREFSLPIGALARSVGCKVQTIRYYEQVGLLPPAARTPGAQRRYGELHQQKLARPRAGIPAARDPGITRAGR